MNYKNNLFKLVLESKLLLILVLIPETYKISEESIIKDELLVIFFLKNYHHAKHT